MDGSRSSSWPARLTARNFLLLTFGLVATASTIALPLYGHSLEPQPATSRAPTTRQRAPGRPLVQPASYYSETLVVNSDGERQLERVAPEPGHGQAQVLSSTAAAAAAATRQRKAKRLRKTSNLGNLFREQVQDYPEEEIARLLKGTPESVKDHFNVINTHLDPHINLTERTVASHPKSYTNYDDEDADRQPPQAGAREESLCRTVTRNIYPREAHHQNSLVYIPNTQDFMQVIQAELCQHPDRDCNYIQDSLPFGMSSLCVQKYSYKKLLYMDPLEKRMASDLFRYPSCCACHVRHLPLDLRSGANATSAAIETPSHEPATKEAKSGDESPLPAGQPSDRYLGPPRAKQLKQQAMPKSPASSNQTVVLSDDKVYVAPSEAVAA